MKYYLKINVWKFPSEELGEYKMKHFGYTTTGVYYDRVIHYIDIIQIPELGSFIYLNNLGKDICKKVIETGELWLIHHVNKLSYRNSEIKGYKGEIYIKENKRYVPYQEETSKSII